MDDFLWRFGRRQRIQRCRYDPQLIFRIEWAAAGMAERVVDENTAWCTSGLDDIERACETNGGEACCFQVSCNQTHGLMTDWSHRDQKNSIDILLSKSLLNLGDQLLTDPALRVDPSHTGEDFLSNFANVPLCFQ